MGSIAAELVGNDVLEKVRNGEIPNLQVIQRKRGYSPKSAKSMKAVATQTYKRTVKPLADQLEAERQAILDRMPDVRNKAKYRDLSDALAKVTQVKQLVTGKATENIAVITLNEADRAKLDLLLDDKQEGPQESN